MQLELFEVEPPQSAKQDRIDLLVFKMLHIIKQIKQQPLLVRAQLLTILEEELDDTSESTFAELRKDEPLLIYWAEWHERMSNVSH